MRQIVSEMQAQQRVSSASKNSDTANMARFERYRLLMDLYKSTGQVCMSDLMCVRVVCGLVCVRCVCICVVSVCAGAIEC